MQFFALRKPKRTGTCPPEITLQHRNSSLSVFRACVRATSKQYFLAWVLEHSIGLLFCLYLKHVVSLSVVFSKEGITLIVLIMMITVLITAMIRWKVNGKKLMFLARSSTLKMFSNPFLYRNARLLMSASVTSK